MYEIEGGMGVSTGVGDGGPSARRRDGTYGSVSLVP